MPEDFYASSGPLPSASALKNLRVPNELVQKLYYRTASNSAFPGREIAKERDENFLNIHAIGQKPTKYMDVKGFRAPLVNRLACAHTRTYVPLPLGDFEINRALAENFKQGYMSQQSLYKPLGTQSLYHSDFEDVGPKERLEMMRHAKQKNAAPKKGLTDTLNGAGGLLEVASNEHLSYQEPNLALAKAERAKLPMPGYGMYLDGAAKAVRAKSAYEGAFGAEQAAANRSKLRKNASEPQLGIWKVGGPSHDAAPDPHPIIKQTKRVRRAPNLSPGM